MNVKKNHTVIAKKPLYEVLKFSQCFIIIAVIFNLLLISWIKNFSLDMIHVTSCNYFIKVISVRIWLYLDNLKIHGQLVHWWFSFNVLITNYFDIDRNTQCISVWDGGSGVRRPELAGGCKTTCLLTMAVTSCDLG